MALIIIVAAVPIVTLHVWAADLFRSNRMVVVSFLLGHFAMVTSELLLYRFQMPMLKMLVVSAYGLTLFQLVNYANMLRRRVPPDERRRHLVVSLQEHWTKMEDESYRKHSSYALALSVQMIVALGHTAVLLVLFQR